MIKELSEIAVWEQYKKNDGVVSYFKFIHDYIEQNYRNLFYSKDGEIGKIVKEFSINQAETDFLVFYLEAVYNMKRPHYLVDRTYWDNAYLYDSYFQWDAGGEATLVPIYLLRKIWFFLYTFKYPLLNIPSLAGIIADFIEEEISTIKITPDEYRIKSYVVEMPLNRYSFDLKTIYSTYRNIFNLPVGLTLQLQIEGGEEDKEGDQ